MGNMFMCSSLLYYAVSLNARMTYLFTPDLFLHRFGVCPNQCFIVRAI